MIPAQNVFVVPDHITADVAAVLDPTQLLAEVFQEFDAPFVVFTEAVESRGVATCFGHDFLFS